MVSVLSFTRQVFLTLALSLLVNGLVVPSNEDSVALDKRSPGFLKLDFTVARGQGKESLNLTSTNKPYFVYHEKSKRATGEPEVTLINEKTFYATDLEIGSNKQAVTTLIDTGSSDLWVVDKSAKCQVTETGQSSTYCYEYGVYDHTKSSSYHSLGSKFSIEYVDGTSSTGTWVKDDVYFAGTTTGVTQLQFGDVTTTSSGFGVLGIGYEANESTNTEYPNLPVLLKTQGVIAKTAYSLYLAQEDATSGSVIFGGIDQAKYLGSLITLPVTSSRELAIHLGSVAINGKTISANLNPVLDSGTTLTYLPTKIVASIASALSGTADSSVGYIINCNQPSNKYLTFNFDSGATINVPLSELAIDLYLTNGQKYQYCALGVFATSSTPILGDNFLRSAYVAYDLDDNTISLAQVKYTTAENIVPF